MKVNFRIPTSWADVNDQLALALGLGEGSTEVRAYRGVAHAVTETAVGLSKMYPLKKKIIFFQDIDPTHNEAMTLLAKEGIQMIRLKAEDMATPEKWMGEVGKETLFVLYSADDPLLGKVFPFAKIEEAMKESTVQRIRVSHSRHEFAGVDTNPDKNATHIYRVGPSQAISIVGERARVGSLTAQSLDWQGDWDLSAILKKKSEKRDLVLDFEKSEIAGAKPFFSAADERVFDRVAVYWSDMDGAAVLDRLAIELKLNLSAPGQDERLETTSLTRWGGVRTMDWLKAWGISPDVIRGLILISTDLIDSAFKEKLLKVRQDLLKDQFG